METRASRPLEVLDECPGEQHKLLKGSKLPTHKEVLLCYLANVNHLKLDTFPAVTEKVKHDAAKCVANQIVQFYGKARIHVFTEKNLLSAKSFMTMTTKSV